MTMFSGKTHLLSTFADAGLDAIPRECEFAFAGKIPSNIAPRLVSCQSEKHLAEAADKSGIAGIVATPDIADKCPEGIGLAISEKPYLSLCKIQTVLADDASGQWNSFPSRIHPTAQIHPGAYVAENDVEIGEGSTIYPNAVIMPRSLIGANSSIGPGAVVGCDAFEVGSDGEVLRILPQSGGVLIGNHVDIQAKCTIVRATFGGFTEIGDETKLDCQIHLAHDCRVGRRVRIAACAEISGRVDIGDDAFLGPNVTVSNGITIGNGAHLTLGSTVVRDVENGSRVTGLFAIDHAKWLKFLRTIR